MKEAPRAPKSAERRTALEFEETRVYTFRNPTRENVDGSNSFEGLTWEAEITLRPLSAADRINADDAFTKTLRKAEYVFITPNGTRINAFHALGRDPIPLYVDTSVTTNICRIDFSGNQKQPRAKAKERNLQVNAVDSVAAARVLLHEIAHSTQIHDQDYSTDWFLHYNHKRLKEEQALTVLSPFAQEIGQDICNRYPEVAEAWEVAKRELPTPAFFTPEEIKTLKAATISERKKYYAFRVSALKDLRKTLITKREEFDRILNNPSASLNFKEIRGRLNQGILKNMEKRISNTQEEIRQLEPFLLILNAREHVLMYPEKRLERDAWRRTILSMRGLRSMGIDLFGETKEEDETAFSHLNSCLDSYDATQGRTIRHAADLKALSPGPIETSEFFEEKKAA